jgi:hypothetical protein
MGFLDDNFNADEARAKLDFKRNPPENAPGQGDGTGWNNMGDNDPFSSFGSSNDPFGSSGGSPFGSSDPFGSGSGNAFGGNSMAPASGNAFGGTGQGGSALDSLFGNSPGVGVQGQGYQGAFNPNNQGQKAEKPEIEDLIIKGAVVGGKSFVSGSKVFYSEVMEAIRDNNEVDTFRFGGKMIKVGGITAGVGLALTFLAKVLPGLNEVYTSALVIGGGISAVIGWVCFSWKAEAAKKFLEEGANFEEEEEEQPPEPEEEPSFEQFQQQDDEPAYDFGNDSEQSAEDLFKDWDLGETEEEEEDNTPLENPDIGDKLEGIDDDETLKPGLYTRQLLFDKWCEILPKVTPNFSEIEYIDSDSEEFLQFNEMLNDAAEIAAVKEDDLPDIEDLTKTLFIYQLKCTREGCKGKEQKVADEVVSMYIKDSRGAVMRDRAGSYATVSTLGKRFFINLFKGADANVDKALVAVSIGDLYKNEEVRSFVLDTGIQMPYIWGIDEYGTPVISDFAKMESLIFSGVARSGKSWKMQSTILQMCMYSSPLDIEFYICDTKNVTSDYYKPSKILPHIKKFSGTKSEILSTLRWLVDEESLRRAAILKSSDSISIKDYNRKNPDNKLPYIYLIVDEMMALMNEMTKDETNEFNSYAVRVVSKYPNLGFRSIFIPHRISNDCISKDIYALVKNKVAIKANFDEMKTGLEVTNKNFPYRLPNVGDMAVKVDDVDNGNPKFCHAEIITPTNEENLDIFKYVAGIWKKLEPDCVKPKTNQFSRVSGNTSTNHVPKRRNPQPEPEVSPIDEALQEIGDTSLDDFWNS